MERVGPSAFTWVRPSFGLAVLVSLLLLAATGYLRLAVFPEQTVPLALGLPLLICLWHRHRRVLWGMVVALVLMTLVKYYWLMPAGSLPAWFVPIAVGMHLVNTGVIALVIHVWINAAERLERKNADLETSNTELQASNEELAAREEEISRQHEEMQAQTEELERQNEELQQQAEELARQSDEVQATNEELARREAALRALMEAGRWSAVGSAEPEVLARICEAALMVLDEDAVAAAIVERQEADLVICGHWGFGPAGPALRRWSYAQSLALLAMERGQTAYLQDIELREDLEIPQPADGERFRSVLVSPLRIEGRIVGAVEVYSRRPRAWTEGSFRVIEWLAGQASIVLESSRQHRELEQRRHEAEEASERKTRFLSAVSHDVRTPANAIGLMADWIIRAAGDPTQRAQLPELVMDLRDNARSLVALVTDVLDLSRFDSGRVEVQVGELSACALIQAEIRQLQPLAREKGLELSGDLPGEDIWVRSDRMKLARIIGNLIGNAVKFTETGSVRVACQRLEHGGAEIRVIDSGVGISEDHLARIFDEFFQLRNPERDRTKGTGLGLAISKRLADALGCSLTVRSTVGQGSTFVLGIPPELVVAAPAAKTPLSQAGGDAERAALEGVRVLLVEDHDTTRVATARLLASEGAVVYQAENGRMALHLLAHEDPQVLLLDLMLPDIDGSEVLRHLRRQRPASLRRVLAVSGDVTAARMHEVRQLGADDLMPKPIDMDRLIQAIKPASGRSDRVMKQ